MVQVHPQFITDTVGKKLVVLSLDEFDAMIEELEDLEDVRLYDEAKREDDGSRISIDDYEPTQCPEEWLNLIQIGKEIK